MQKPRKKLPNGFTLIELLVVIAIIALLLSILMPALNQVKEQFRVIVSGSNQHQVGQVVHTYAADFDGHTHLTAAFLVDRISQTKQYIGIA